jgi:lipopolysaccharide/colanic/teichoic acid biosynthesis glycosyltransferase
MLAGTRKELVVRAPPAAGVSVLAERGAACVALVIASVPALLTAGIIWAALGRPLLFRQVRSGLGREPFTLVKFRTMRELRDATGSLLPDRERETAATRLIRRLRLDEIPQLLAIAAGEMRFVGPRPLKPETVDAFGPLGEVRASVPPGLTGWAQVNGNTRLTDTEKLALDIWYVDHRSLALDARIVLLTVATLLFGERVHPTALLEAEAHLASRQGGPGASSTGGARA